MYVPLDDTKFVCYHSRSKLIDNNNNNNSNNNIISSVSINSLVCIKNFQYQPEGCFCGCTISVGVSTTDGAWLSSSVCAVIFLCCFLENFSLMIIPITTLAVTIASTAKRTPITIPATDGLPPAVSQISQEMMAVKQLHKC